ncbi:hypothetical protein [Nonomuraea sp. NPDC050783]|uniref:hypothetical protein n=1 Tax=Nonomuraea sp. NPDC050783 TaxID=3154634 RepID=UPI003466439B
MKRRLRSLLAIAMGAAVLLGGTGTSDADARTTSALAGDFTGDASASASVPLQNEVEGTVTLNLRSPGEVTSVTGGIEPPGQAARAVTFDFRTGDAAATQRIVGRWRIGADDPAGEWKLSVVVARAGGTGTTPFVVRVAGKQGISAAKVTPDPVKLVTGKDVKVSVEATVRDAASVSAKLVSGDGGELYDLGDLAGEAGGTYRGSTYLADDTTPGDWTLEVYAHRGGQTLKGVAGFTVAAPANGTTRKARSRVTISAPDKVRAGKPVKVYGKVYRGTKPYKGKTIEVYFKAKGTRTYKLLGFARTTSTGKYAKTYKARKDGYYRVKVPGTRTTRASLSPQEFVDVR